MGVRTVLSVPNEGRREGAFRDRRRFGCEDRGGDQRDAAEPEGSGGPIPAPASRGAARRRAPTVSPRAVDELPGRRRAAPAARRHPKTGPPRHRNAPSAGHNHALGPRLSAIAGSGMKQRTKPGATGSRCRLSGRQKERSESEEAAGRCGQQDARNGVRENEGLPWRRAPRSWSKRASRGWCGGRMAAGGHPNIRQPR